MKRFTDTDKWRDPWFRNLSGAAKLLWSYLTENCDAIGLVTVDFRLVSQDCRMSIKEHHLSELGDRVEALGHGRFFLPKFIQFQYGELSADCPPHKTILRLVDTHKLTRSGLHYHYPNATLVATLAPTYKTRQEEDKTGSGSEEGTGRNPSPAQEVLVFLNAQTGRNFRETAVNLSFIASRLAEPGVTLDGVKIMIVRQCNRWLRTDQAEYLRPETLFNKTKFDGYYAAKDLPTHATNQRNHSTGHQRTTGADQRKVGIPAVKSAGNLSDLLAARARKATAHNVAAKPSSSQRDQSGGSTHG